MRVDASSDDTELAARIRSRVADVDASAFRLTIENGRVLLEKPGQAGGVCVETADVARRVRGGARSDLARACGARTSLRVLDAMAGFGIDGLVLASLGCRVTMIEKSPVVFTMLENLVDRSPPELQRRVQVSLGDGLESFGRAAFDVIYLDPMFDMRAKRALPNRRAQWLIELLSDQPRVFDIDALDRARRAACERVVVKRRRTDPVLARSDWRIVGRSVRFDVYRPLRG